MDLGKQWATYVRQVTAGKYFDIPIYLGARTFGRTRYYRDEVFAALMPVSLKMQAELKKMLIGAYTDDEHSKDVEQLMSALFDDMRKEFVKTLRMNRARKCN